MGRERDLVVGKRTRRRPVFLAAVREPARVVSRVVSVRWLKIGHKLLAFECDSCGFASGGW